MECREAPHESTVSHKKPRLRSQYVGHEVYPDVDARGTERLFYPLERRVALIPLIREFGGARGRQLALSGARIGAAATRA
jgi:hypothetical protein